MASIDFRISTLERITGFRLEYLEKTLPELGFPVEFAEVEGEKRIAVEVTPDRPDMLSVFGIKRLLEQHKDGQKMSWKSEKSTYRCVVDPSVKGVRDYIGCMVAKNVDIDLEIFDDLIQFQEKLHTTLGRKRKKLAIGFHDLSKVKFPVAYRAYGLEEKSFVPLDTGTKMTLKQILSEHPKGMEYSGLVEEKGVIVEDSEDVLAFPPIINSERTRVSENTKGFFVDVTGNNLYYVQKTIDMIACALIEMGAEIHSVSIEYPDKDESFNSPLLSQQKFPIPKPEQVKQIIGIEADKKSIKESLERMGYSVKGTEVSVAPYRVDVLKDIDLLEDIAIVYGFNNIPKVLPELSTAGKLDESTDKLHEAMIAMGFSEIMSWVLGNENKYSDYYSGEYAKMINSLTTDFSLVRPMLTPNMIEVFARNKTFDLPQRIYEIGQVTIKQNGKLITSEKICFGIMDNNIGINEIIGIMNGLAHALGIYYELEQEEIRGFIPGRSAAVKVNGKQIGFVGEVHPEVLGKFGIGFPIAICELDVKTLTAKR